MTPVDVIAAARSLDSHAAQDEVYVSSYRAEDDVAGIATIAGEDAPPERWDDAVGVPPADDEERVAADAGGDDTPAERIHAPVLHAPRDASLAEILTIRQQALRS